MKREALRLICALGKRQAEWTSFALSVSPGPGSSVLSSRISDYHSPWSREGQKGGERGHLGGWLTFVPPSEEEGGLLRGTLLKKCLRFPGLASLLHAELRGGGPASPSTQHYCPPCGYQVPPAPEVGAEAPGRCRAPCWHCHQLLASGFQGLLLAGPWPWVSGPGNRRVKPWQATPRQEEKGRGRNETTPW